MRTSLFVLGCILGLLGCGGSEGQPLTKEVCDQIKADGGPKFQACERFEEPAAKMYIPPRITSYDITPKGTLPPQPGIVLRIKMAPVKEGLPFTVPALDGRLTSSFDPNWLKVFVADNGQRREALDMHFPRQEAFNLPLKDVASGSGDQLSKEMLFEFEFDLRGGQGGRFRFEITGIVIHVQGEEKPRVISGIQIISEIYKIE